MTLVAPNGTPVGGELQQWANAAQVPTLNGPLTTDTNASDVNAACARAPACSTAPGSAEEYDGGLIYGQPAETWVAPDAVNQWQFDFELGHQFDYAYLTRTDRAEFAQLWGSTLHWWDTSSGLARGIEDGLEAEFADVYATCAVGYSAPEILTAWLPSVIVTTAAPSCQLINRIDTTNAAPSSLPTLTNAPRQTRRRKRRRRPPKPRTGHTARLRAALRSAPGRI
ncbi:MAG: hypothetical protein JO325_23115 [Solirubrobacterales bacterium]|nr:hypothetical protein [Solirubrobacterales bacterium]